MVEILRPKGGSVISEWHRKIVNVLTTPFASNETGPHYDDSFERMRDERTRRHEHRVEVLTSAQKKGVLVYTSHIER